jgi:uncharacterized protein YgbK (DUF1537 family)
VFADADIRVVNQMPLWLRGGITQGGVEQRRLAVDEISLQSRQLPGSAYFLYKVGEKLSIRSNSAGLQSTRQQRIAVCLRC